MAARTTKKKRGTKKRSTKKKKASSKKNGAKAKGSNGKGGDNVVDINKGSPNTPSEHARSQEHLPGMEPKRDAKLSALADELYNARTERLAQGRLETEAQAKLLAEMQGRDLESYIDVELGFKVTIEATDYKVKVKKFDPDEGEQ